MHYDVWAADLLLLLTPKARAVGSKLFSRWHFRSSFQSIFILISSHFAVADHSLARLPFILPSHFILLAHTNTSTMSPEPDSIQAIIRQHPRSGLYIRPILWTPLHLKLLGCEFVRIKPPAKGLQRVDDGVDALNGGSKQRWNQQRRVRVLKHLSTLGSRDEARERVLDILQSYNPLCFFE